MEHFNIGGTNALEFDFAHELFCKPEDMKAVKEADCVVVCLGHDSVTEKENSDRTFELPYGQVDYLRTVLKYNKNVVVVLNGGGGIEMASWLPEVKAS